LPRVIDLLGALADAVALAPAEDRRTEACLLLVHLLQVYGLKVQRYLEWVQLADADLEKAIARIRLVC
jgi:hypothetical protein